MKTNDRSFEWRNGFQLDHFHLDDDDNNNFNSLNLSSGFHRMQA